MTVPLKSPTEGPDDFIWENVTSILSLRIYYLHNPKRVGIKDDRLLAKNVIQIHLVERISGIPPAAWHPVTPKGPNTQFISTKPMIKN